MSKCTAHSKRTGERCKAQAVTGRTVCYHHGGAIPRGRALPQTTHGRYSKHLPTRMLATYEQASQDAELLNLRADIALLDARLADLLGRVDSGESGTLWQELRTAWKTVKRAPDAEDAAAIAFAELGPLIERGYQDTQAWGEIGRIIEQRRKLAESERKRLVEMQQMMTAGQAQLLIARLYDVVTQHVSDRAAIAAIGAELEALAGAGEPVPTSGPAPDNQ